MRMREEMKEGEVKKGEVRRRRRKDYFLFTLQRKPLFQSLKKGCFMNKYLQMKS